MIDYDCGALLGDRYEDVYDHEGEGVYSECCGVYLMWDSRRECYICPGCGKRISRRNFMDEYVEAYGPECYFCRTNFPLCGVCHKNHQQELDERETHI